MNELELIDEFNDVIQERESHLQRQQLGMATVLYITIVLLLDRTDSEELH